MSGDMDPEIPAARWYCKSLMLQTSSLGAESTVQTHPATAYPKDYLYMRDLGHGSEAKVSSWVHLPSGTVIAVKAYRKTQKYFPREVKVLKHLPKHALIINCLAYLPHSQGLSADCVLFEHCAHGDLFSLRAICLDMNNGIFVEACLWTIYNQLAAAMAFLHEGIGCLDPADAEIWRPVIHRDIKLENIFICALGESEDFSNIQIKVGDFGLATFYRPPSSPLPGSWGTTVMWPPEQTWEGRAATPAGDIWAIGSIVHELAHGFPPVVDSEITKRNMQTEELQSIAHWNRSKQKAYVSAKSQRKPIPINLDPAEQEDDDRRVRATPRYSDALNGCMMAALDMNMVGRVTADTLKDMIEEESAAYHFEELKKETEVLQQETSEYFSEDEWTD